LLQKTTVQKGDALKCRVLKEDKTCFLKAWSNYVQKKTLSNLLFWVLGLNGRNALQLKDGIL
jgi:hypothetical protein